MTCSLKPETSVLIRNEKNYLFSADLKKWIRCISILKRDQAASRIQTLWTCSLTLP